MKFSLQFSEVITAEAITMASRKRPYESTKPETPTNGLDTSLEEIDIHNGSNSSMDDHSNGHSTSSVGGNPIKNASPSRPVSLLMKWENEQMLN